MLAARYGQDHRRPPAYGLDQGIIRRCVACMQGDDHIRIRLIRILCDIALQKAQSVIIQILGNTAAKIDHVFLQIQTDDVNVFAEFQPEVVVKGEGQVGFSAAEIYDAKRLSLVRQKIKSVRYYFKEAVDLTKLCIMLLDYMTLMIHDAEADQEITIGMIRYDVLLLKVVRKSRHSLCGCLFYDLWLVRI